MNRTKLKAAWKRAKDEGRKPLSWRLFLTLAEARGAHGIDDTANGMAPYALEKKGLMRRGERMLMFVTDAGELEYQRTISEEQLKSERAAAEQRSADATTHSHMAEKRRERAAIYRMVLVDRSEHARKARVKGGVTDFGINSTRNLNKS